MATEKPKPPTSTDAKDAAATKNETKEKKDVAALEEDDQFEDFPASAWEETEEDKMNTHAWEDAWEDDEEITDFAEQLRKEEGKRTGVAPMKM